MHIVPIPTKITKTLQHPIARDINELFTTDIKKCTYNDADTRDFTKITKLHQFLEFSDTKIIKPHKRSKAESYPKNGRTEYQIYAVKVCYRNIIIPIY